MITNTLIISITILPTLTSNLSLRSSNLDPFKLSPAAITRGTSVHKMGKDSGKVYIEPKWYCVGTRGFYPKFSLLTIE